MMFQHLRAQRAPFVLRRGRELRLGDELEHRDAYDSDARRYALMLLMEGAQAGQRSRGLYQLLAGSRKGMCSEDRAVIDRVIEILGATLPADEVLRVFLATKRARANHKHTRRAILRWVLDHPALEDMAAHRRPTLVDCLEHALGVDVARACAKRLAADTTGSPITEPYVQRNLLRYTNDTARARAIVPALFGRAPLPVARTADYRAPRGRLDRPDLELPKTVTATNRGDISATLVHLYRGGTDPELRRALDRFVDLAAAEVPRFGGKLALVLDASASTRGYGDREYCNIAQAVGLRLVLERCVRELTIVTVGGEGGELPVPAGASDLAMGVLEALGGDPDVVLVVTDGYENVYQGDLASVLEALPQAGVEVPVVIATGTFTWKDNLALRRVAHGTANVELWHQSDYRRVALTAFALARGEAGTTFMNDYLEQRLLELGAALPKET